MEILKKIVRHLPHFCKNTNNDDSKENVRLSKTLDSLDPSFKIIAVRCNSEESKGKRKLVNCKIYYFFQGYKINGGTLTIESDRDSIDKIYDDYYTDLAGKPHVQICAIVGQNGAGKSSIIEFMLRLINNFAAATIGELSSNPAADHLHYIDGIKGDLWYSLGKNVYRLGIENYHVTLIKFQKSTDSPINAIEKYTEDIQSIIYDNQKQVQTITPNQFFTKIDEEKLKDIYSNMFYTLVSNYSIYAYNSNDFKDECNSKEKEDAIQHETRSEINTSSIENRCWLHGLFHKNDGYLTPIVLTPYRHEGNIDINKENDLGHEHLISLFIRQDDFRKINDHLSAEGVRYGIWTIRDYDYEWFCSSLGMKEITPQCYQKLKYFIIRYWSQEIGFNIDGHKYDGKEFYNNAIEYIAYKTIKVSKQYEEHHDFYKDNQHVIDDFDLNQLKELIKSESEDKSHITRKIFQAIAYLVYDIYTTKGRRNTTSFEVLKNRWIKNKPKAISDISIHLHYCALIPPPFMDSQILMKETITDKIIPFETLSSGEKQQLYSTGSLCYHLDNINSAHLDKSNSTRILYNNVNIILEEIELYYHLELQQQLVKFLIDRIQRLNLEHLRGINIMIVTHSPYVLSDIPKENVLALKKDGSIVTNLLTFGANIHEMLKDSFFLENGSQGYFAQWEIGHILACFEVYKSSDEEVLNLYHSDNNIYRFLKRYIVIDRRNSESFNRDVFSKEQSKDVILKRIEMIDESVVKTILKHKYNSIFMS